MKRQWIVVVAIFGLTCGAAAQKPRAQGHHAKAAEHKPAPVALPKAGGGANGADAQLKRLEQQTTKTAGANPQKQKAAAPVKYKPEAPRKNVPIDFKAQPHQAKGGGQGGVPKNALRARH
jgi:hypothetical protein